MTSAWLPLLNEMTRNMHAGKRIGGRLPSFFQRALGAGGKEMEKACPLCPILCWLCCAEMAVFSNTNYGKSDNVQ